jgi:hypothetical protein
MVQQNGLKGITWFREMMAWLDNRHESLNADKTPKQLMQDYVDYLKANR